MVAPHMLAAPKQVAYDLPPQTFIRFEIPLPDVDSTPLPTSLPTVHLPTVHYPTRSSPKVSKRDLSLPPSSFGEYENTRYTPVPSNPAPQAVPITLPSRRADSSHTDAPPDTASIPSLSIRTKFPYPAVAAQAHVAHSAAKRLKKTPADGAGVTIQNKGQEPPACPPGFHRGRSLLHEYTPFEAFLVLADLNGFYQQIPRLPAALVSHDVFHEDWIRAMQDLAFAWSGRIPAPELGQEIKRNDRLHPGEVVAAMVDIWNARFFEPRLVELIVYRGRLMDSEDKKPLLHSKPKGYSNRDEPARRVQGQQFFPDWWYWVPIVVFGWPILVGIVLGVAFGLRAAVVHILPDVGLHIALQLSAAEALTSAGPPVNKFELQCITATSIQR
ncbi:hypothetical protein EXIGLDRAFT_765233 [Exidia glandulosa HHB12029]|uniref:Uncharacterized protein n=1 Tax=Exidia glandulosa HHB12029 TaxID=1314781 RepID=A0A165KM81_EXIGL|nr:hypothetical protein EXIGLDRAFT_765233 [Exidia glandulosa HHB12029]